jgi:hypothetical protein
MAVVTNLDTDIVKQVERDTINASGSLYISRVFLTDNTDTITDISELDNSTQLTANTLLIGTAKLSVVIQASLGNSVTYKVVYLCNSNNDILGRIDIEEITASEINDTFVLDFNETNEVV